MFFGFSGEFFKGSIVSSSLGVIKSWLAMLVAAFLLTGCLGGSDGGTAATSISGVAATGLPMAGTVELVDANGETSDPATIGAGGAFEIDTTGLTAPFILRATGSGGSAGTVLYSLADGTTGTFNITPLTHLALELIRQELGEAPADLAGLFSGWNAQFDSGDLAALQTTLQQMQSRINANLRTQMEANGLTVETYDFLRTAFAANSAGIDAVLDAITITFNGNEIIIGEGEGSTPFNIEIDISGFNIGGGSGGGNGGGACSGTSLTYAGTSSGSLTNGSTVCFSTISSTTLAFGSTTLTNPTQNQAVSAPYSAYAFTDSATGLTYEVVFNNAALHEINVSDDSFLGQLTESSSGGASGSLTLTVSTLGVVAYSMEIADVPAPASEAEFCADMNDPNSTFSLDSALSGVGGSATVDSCSFSGSEGTVAVTVNITSPIVATVPYTVVFTFN
jgi:hypothetical protein